MDSNSTACRADATSGSRLPDTPQTAPGAGLRDARRRDDLVLSNLGFVVSVARCYRSAGIPLEELVNEGALGLMEAARRFEPERDVRFITYASWWIRKSMRNLVERSRVVRIPPYRLRRVKEALEQGGPVRTETGFLEALATGGIHPVSVDDGEPPMVERLTLPGQADPEQALLSAEAVRAVTRSVSLLNEQQRVVIRARFGLDGDTAGTLRSIGSRLGVSRERVRQIESQAVARLRRLLAAGGPRASEATTAAPRPRPVVTRSSSVRNNRPVHSRPVTLKHANPRIATGPGGGTTIRSGHPISQEDTRE